MKYLKKSAEVLIGKAGSQNEQKLSKYGLTDHTAMLTLVTHYSDGSGEQLSGICVTREHLGQMRNAIDDYLSRTDNNTPFSEEVGSVNNFSIKPEMSKEEAACFIAAVKQVTEKLRSKREQKQTQLEVDPRLIMVNQLKPTGEPDSWSAKIHILGGLKDFFANGRRCGKLELSVFGDCEESARKRLNISFHDLIMICLNPDLSESRIPNIVQENSKQTNKSDDKDATQFKLNPSRVMSMKVGVDKWEARTRVFNGIGNGLVDLVATGVSEEAAREELDKKFLDFAGPMTNFIKFMSQAS